MFKIIKIIAGKNKGFVLKTKDDLTTRPTLNRIKENVFNILRELISGSSFLDLFAGSGGIGLEAVSRGAKRVVLVEKDKKAYNVVLQNIEKTKTKNITKAVHLDFEKYLTITKEKFNLIYIDPPYDLNIYKKSLDLIGQYGLLLNEGRIIIESKKDSIIPMENNYFLCYREVIYGSIKMLFYKENRR